MTERSRDFYRSQVRFPRSTYIHGKKHQNRVSVAVLQRGVECHHWALLIHQRASWDSCESEKLIYTKRVNLCHGLRRQVSWIYYYHAHFHGQDVLYLLIPLWVLPDDIADSLIWKTKWDLYEWCWWISFSFCWEHRVSFISCRTSTNAGSTCYIFSICSSIRTKVCFHTIIFRLDHNAFYVLLFFHLWSRSVCSLEPNFSSLLSPHPEASSRHELGGGGQNEWEQTFISCQWNTSYKG